MKKVRTKFQKTLTTPLFKNEAYLYDGAEDIKRFE